jgi:hypothetical protein
MIPDQLITISGLRMDGSYPDENAVAAPPDTTWLTATFDNPRLPPGDSGWAYYQGVDYQAVDQKLLTGKPTLVADKVGSGTAYFDDLVVEELDENHGFVRIVTNLNITSTDEWSFWSRDGRGGISLAADGHADAASLALGGSDDYTAAYDDGLRFAVTPGHYYRISGWMKGKSIPSAAVAQIRIDFETSPSGGALYRRNKAYLKAMFEQDMKWGRDNNVPIYVGEFGLNNECFKSGKGGLNWVSDMLDLLNASGVSYTYHDYHEPAFGLYLNDGALPDPARANQALIDLLTEKS